MTRIKNGSWTTTNMPWCARLLVFTLLNSITVTLCVANSVQSSTQERHLATMILDNYIKAFPSEVRDVEVPLQGHIELDVRPPKLTEKTKR